VSTRKEGNYSIGYGRPPKHTQFRKGQSGNPSGGRASSSFAMQLNKALKKMMLVKINGRNRRITRLELIAQQTVNRAAAADWRFVKLLFELELLTGDRGELLPRGPDGKPKIPLTLLREIMDIFDENAAAGEKSDE
jgi:hypothetical protein